MAEDKERKFPRTETRELMLEYARLSEIRTRLKENRFKPSRGAAGDVTTIDMSGFEAPGKDYETVAQNAGFSDPKYDPQTGYLAVSGKPVDVKTKFNEYAKRKFGVEPTENA